MTPNTQAFLDVIAHSELGAEILDQSDNGYNVIVGSTPGNVNTFSNYSDHPRQKVWLDHLQEYSSAAGRYQIMERFFDDYRKILNLDDTNLYPDGPFSPPAQDAIALQLIRECHAMNLIANGEVGDAVAACSSRWASFPGNKYGQHQNKIDDLEQAFVQSGGILG